MITLSKNNILHGEVKLLPASKSISNRVLIMNALAGNQSQLRNLSDANDTQLMMKLVNSSLKTIDAEDAGTTMRFLTAYFSVTNQHKILTGSHRMKERPIGILVDALRTLGVDISYLEKEGYPPLEVKGFLKQKAQRLQVRGDVSSQFISALMMIAPLLPQGLTLELQGKIGSVPYIQMTASLMREFNVESSFFGNTINVEPQRYKSTDFTVESDWSAASYWFAFAALSSAAEIYLPRLYINSLQGDSVIALLMKKLGVSSEFTDDKIRITMGSPEKELTWDFTHCPDLAQTVAVVCTAKGIVARFTGLESLRIKETDRITALQMELRKIGADLIELNAHTWELKPSSKLPESVSIQTYKDHRMAMAFAPLACLMQVTIEDPEVVRKSYPRFWDDVKSFGFEIN